MFDAKVETERLQKKFRTLLSKKVQDRIWGNVRKAGLREIQKAVTKRGYGFGDRTGRLRASMRGVGGKTKGKKGIVRTGRNYHYLVASGEVQKRRAGSPMKYYAYVVEKGRKGRGRSSPMQARPFLMKAALDQRKPAFNASAKAFLTETTKAIAKLR